MKVLTNDSIAFFDVDETLILWSEINLATHPDDIIIQLDNQVGVPHKRHVASLKRHKARGHTIVVWSQGGYAWAEHAIKLLRLEKYVDLICRKPAWFYDDIPSSEFMPESSRVYHKK